MLVLTSAFAKVPMPLLPKPSLWKLRVQRERQKRPASMFVGLLRCTMLIDCRLVGGNNFVYRIKMWALEVSNGSPMGQ